jgi:hypothetical protein
VTVSVTGFQVGTTAADDGVVVLTFSGGSAGCTSATLSAEVPMRGSGELSYVLPAGCTGTSLTLTATLRKPDGVTPLSPAVSRSITITVL